MSLLEQCGRVTGPLKNILVCDAGGLRGIFALEMCVILAQKQRLPLTRLISLCAGASSGAMVATIVALGMLDVTSPNFIDIDKLYKLLPFFFHKRANRGPFSPAYTGLGKRQVLEIMLGNSRMRDVKIPLLVICCTIAGESVEFKSWDPLHQDLLLVDVVDASSAIPTIFPPVFVPGFGALADGGIRGATGLIPSLLAVLELFRGQQCQIRMLSLGTQFTEKVRISLADIPKMGLLRWIRCNIIDSLLGTHDNSQERLMRALLGPQFLRIVCDCGNIKFDNISQQAQFELKDAARRVWSQEGTKMLTFVGAIT